MAHIWGYEVAVRRAVGSNLSGSRPRAAFFKSGSTKEPLVSVSEETKAITEGDNYEDLGVGRAMMRFEGRDEFGPRTE